MATGTMSAETDLASSGDSAVAAMGRSFYNFGNNSVWLTLLIQNKDGKVKEWYLQ